jgi:hypothetical protein
VTDNGGYQGFDFTYDPPLSAEEVDRFLGTKHLVQRFMVEEVIRCNPIRVRATVARQLGYDALADILTADADRLEQTPTPSP